MSVELGLLVALLLLIGNAFFVGAEFSLVSVRRSAIEPLAADGSKKALITLQALENLSFLMAGAQLGITLCSLALGAVAEPIIAHLLDTPLHNLHVAENLLHPISFVIALLTTVFLHVIIGEMVPKNIALARPERSALALTPILVSVTRLLKPLVHGLNALASGVLQLMNVSPQTEVASTYTRDEMADLVKESRKSGYLSEDNEQLLSGALTFDAQSVRDIAVPLADVVVVDQTFTPAQIEELSVATGFSRFPIIGKKGVLTGYVHLKDSIKIDETMRHERLPAKYLRELLTVHHNQSIRMTLKTMQRSGAHLAAVTSGKKVIGLVTLEDVLEELVGEMSAD
jgi:CBS domain containing-hemolysin-like protein